MMAILFWISVAALAYTYAIFPLLLGLRARFLPRPYRQEDWAPPVSVVLAARNEAACIGRKADNLLQLDYPPDRIECVIASDGSTDGTESILRAYAERGIRLLALPRQGKAQTLNAAVAAAQGEILVFSDANSMFDPDAIRALVRPFADPQVGGVAGDQRYEAPRSRSSHDFGERRYWDFDRWLKRAESRAGSVISATGAIYAIRKSLFLPIPEGVTDDFVTSTRVIAQGSRLVFAEDAVAWEPPAARQSAEFGRKVRIMTRGLRALAFMKCLFNPFRQGFYALQVFSHKVLRRLMVIPLLVLLVTSLLLIQQSPWYALAAYGQLAFYLSAAVAAGATRTGLHLPKVATLPLYFCLVNLAALIALTRFLTGQSTVVWEPQRTVGEPA